MESYELLKQLADGAYHSGSALGREFGVSRTAVWKALSKLESLGVRVESHKGLGYRIPGGLDLLDDTSIKQKMVADVRSRSDIELLFTTESTNALLLIAPSLPLDSYRFCIAEQQTAGRGRRGRQWFSPMASNIYMSCGFQFEGGVERLCGLSLVAGIACADALASVGVKGLSIKWPNDVWLNEKKLAGILVELRGEPTTGWQVVVGLGLNVWMTEESGGVIDQPWSALSDYPELTRNELVAKLAECMVVAFDQFREHGFSYFLARWAEYDALKGREVMLLGSEQVGVARGVDHSGALLLERAGSLQEVNAGEVSVRLR